LSKTGIISLGIAFVAGKNLVPRPPTGKIAVSMLIMKTSLKKRMFLCIPNQRFTRRSRSFQARIPVFELKAMCWKFL
jgi:hypothetical protein